MSRTFLQSCINMRKFQKTLPKFSNLEADFRSYRNGVEKEINRSTLQTDSANGNVSFAEKTKKRKGPGEWAAELVQLSKVLSVDEWKGVRRDVPVDWDVFESQVMIACCRARNLSLARSLLKFIELENRSPSLVTMSKYVRLCGQSVEEVDEELLLEMLDRIKHRWPLLDGSTTEDIIHGVCRTHRWKDSLRHLEEIRTTCGNPGQSSLAAIASAAFRNNEFDIGWQLMEKLASGEVTASADGPLNEWTKKCQMALVGERTGMMEQMLNFLRSSELFVSREVAEQIKFVFESKLEDHWIGTFTRVSHNGVCRSCKSTLEPITLNNYEFQHLRDSFLQRVIRGSNVFLKSTPAEVQRFQNFVKSTAPYSLVLDGLNVAYCMQRKNVSHLQLAKQLLKAVQHFRQGSNKRILVLGRQHMRSWPRNILDAIFKEAMVFFTDNLSKDDPFLLYAALYSGQGTLFFSKDMMRDHLFCLQDSSLAASFRRWQRGHQLELLGFSLEGKVLYKPPLTHNPITQKAQYQWHVPYIEGKQSQPNTPHTPPDTWLCLSKITSDRPQRV